MYRVYIVEDDEKIAAILRKKMEQYGYEAAAADNFCELLPGLEAFRPQLVLLDINLPYFDGYYWCRQIRMRYNMPIIFISARSGEMDQVMAIENGGDDYITKPIQLELLMAKVRSALRRAYGEYAAAPLTGADGGASAAEAAGQGAGALPSPGMPQGRPPSSVSGIPEDAVWFPAAGAHGQADYAGMAASLAGRTAMPVPSASHAAGLPPAAIAVWGLRLYPGRNELEWNGKRQELTRNEMLLAECLLRRPGEVLAREELLEALWDDVQFVDDNTLTVNVTRLRKKLEELGLPKIVETVRGQGYKLATGRLKEAEAGG